jgi:hypothetical protein
LIASLAPAQMPALHKVPEDVVVLEGAGVKPTAEALAKYLTDQTAAAQKPLTDAEADAVIAKLGNDDFDTREAAMKQLLGLRQPPMARLKAARVHPDLEVRTRTEEILDQLSQRSDPLAAAFRVARDKKVRLDPEPVLAVIARAESIALAEAGRDLLVAQAKADDLAQAKKWAGSEMLAVKAAGLRVWAVLDKGGAVPALRELLKNPTPGVRAAAARALLDVGEEVDALAAVAEVAPEEAVFVLKAAEWKLRNALKDRRKDGKAMEGYYRLLDAYGAVLAKVPGVRTEKLPPQNTQHYLELAHDTTKHPDIVLYKIQWFAGHWSHWYSPGFNDAGEDGRVMRLWSCFNDHNFEVVTTTRRDLFRQILDLDKP